MDVGALSLLISEKGFDATMAKVAALDSAAAKVGARTTELRLSAPGALAVNAALGQVGETATKIGAQRPNIVLSLIGAPQTEAALGEVAAAARALAGQPARVTVTSTGAATVIAALGEIEAEKARAGAPVAFSVQPPTVASTLAALGTVEAEKQKAGVPLTVPVLPPAIGAALGALGTLETAKTEAGTPLTISVTAPTIAPALGALSALDTAKAATSTPVAFPVAPPATGPTVAALGELAAEKAALSAPVVTTVLAPTIGPAVAALGAVEDAKEAVSGSPVVVSVEVPNVAGAENALAGLEGAKEKVSATPVVVPVTPPNVAPSEAALAGLAGAKDAASATPVVTPVVAPDTGPARDELGRFVSAKDRAGAPITTTVVPPNTGPAIAALSALAEAEAVQSERAAALSAALAAAGAASTTTAEKAATLRAALDQDMASTDALSAATKQLDIAQRDGVAVIELRRQAINELIVAQDALARSQSTGAKLTRAPLVGGAQNPVAIGPQLGPATPEAEAFAVRARATAAAFEAEAVAARTAAGAIQQETSAKIASGNAAERLNPKLRSAANGLTAVAFAATSMNGSMQSMALGAGLAASSLASMASGPIALWAAGIGAAITVGAALIGIFDRMTDAASHAATAVDEVTRSIAGIRSLSEAQAAATVAARNLAKAEDELAEAKQRANQPVGTGALDAAALAADLFRVQRLTKEVEQFRDIAKAASHQIAELTVREATDAQAARLGIITAGTAAENQRFDAASKAFLAIEATKFATGRESLDQFFAARLAAIQAGSAREIAALRQRQALLAEPVADATPAESAKRAAEIKRIGSEIAALEARTREETTQTIEQRRTQRESLDRAIIAFEQKEAEAAGDASEQRIAQARVEAREIARTLVQQSGATTPDAFAKAWADANARAQQYVETQTRIIRVQQAQNQAARVFSELGLEREAIQRRLEAGEITAFQAQQQVTAAERARIPALVVIAEQMERFAGELNNPDLLNAAKRLRGEIEGIARTPLSGLAQRLKSVMDDLSLEAGAGNKWAAAILKELQADIDKNGGKVTVGVVVKAEWLKQIKDEIETQGALLEILIKPKNIVLSGVAQALGNLNQQLGSLATNVGNSIGSALAAGFSAAFTRGSGKSFFEAAGNAILQGIGNTMVQLGSAMLTYGLLMAVAGPWLLAAGVFTQQALSAPAAIAAGTGLIALGAGLGAIAANNTGTRTGGGGSSASQPRTAEPTTQRVVLDPDKRIREARDITKQVNVNTGANAAATLPAINVSVVAIGAHDPKVQREIATAVNGAVRRNLIPSIG